MPGAKRRPLTRERVVAAALRLVDRRGLEALSMRRLGGTLGVEAMSLYRHVPNKPALLDLLVERVLAGVVAPPPDATWDARLRHVADELRGVARAHPHVFPLLATRVPASPRALAPLETLLVALADAGLDDDAVLHHFWALVAWTTGALLAETAAATRRGAASLEAPPDLDARAFPGFARFGGAVARCDFAGEFARGLDLLIGAARAAASAPLRRRPQCSRVSPARRSR